MNSRLFHATIVFCLSILAAPFSVFAQDDILIEPPLTWSINSIQIVWSVAQGATTTQETKFIYGADQVNSETFGKDLVDSDSTSRGGSVAGGSRIDAGAKLESNPLTLFGLLGAKVNASAYVEGGFNYNKSLKTTDTTQWSESEKNVVSKALTSAFEQNTQQTISNQRLVFTVDFINHTVTRLHFSPNSANTIPVYCGSTHIGDAHLISENATIAATGKPIPCKFEMALNDTGKQCLINNRPIIKIDGGQLLIQSAPNARERIDDAIQESTVVTSCFTVAILSGNEVKEWKIRYFKRNPVTLQEALEAINENICDLSNDDSKTVFDIQNDQIVSVCGAPLKANSDSEWITELRVIKGTDSQTVSALDLSQTPRRGERYVFQMVSMEIKKLIDKSKAGDAEAQFELAGKYFNGDGVPEDKVRAVKIIRKAAEQGHVRASCFLADCYYEGESVEVNYFEAVKWYQKVSEFGITKAQFRLGLCYYFGNGVPKNIVLAIKYFRKAADLGHVDSQFFLGNCYYIGNGVPEDKAEAVKWYRKAAERGLSSAQYILGRSYEYGNGVVEDKAEAVKWYRKAAEQGDASAQVSLGFCYDQGNGVSEDKSEAVKWYRKAAEKGNADAQFSLGFCYYQGNGVPEDKSEAVNLYRKAAEQGHALAQYFLGRCYDDHKGVSEDKAEAIKWYRKAAEQGLSYAQYNLGNCYVFGKGVKEDKVEAFKWWRKAAEQGFAEAQYNLGVSYANGEGISQNESEAIKWFRKAAEQGNEDAINALKRRNLWY